ncbi:MAG: CxxxxCH/CxxCH domain c-type cytochrome [Nitrospirota bacterium]
MTAVALLLPIIAVTPAWSQWAITSCADCHSNPPVDGSARNVPAGAFVGSHQKHTSSSTGNYAYACTVCHVNNSTFSHRNGNIEMVSPLNGHSGSYGNPSGNVFPQTNTPTLYSCSNTYCHSTGAGGTSQSGDARAVAANTSPVWGANGTIACNSCHGSESGNDGTGRPHYTAGTPKSNSHESTRHTSLSCDKCHYTTTTTASSITDTTKHANRTYDVVGAGSVPYTFTYAYNADGGSCATGYCHGPASPAWGTTGTLTCNACHQSQGADNSALADRFAPKHEKHTSAGFYTYSCEMCHALGNTTNGNVIHAGGPALGGSNPGGDTAGANQTAEIRFRDNGATWSTAAYNGSAAAAYRFRTLYANPYDASAPTPAYADGTASGTDTVNGNIFYTTTGSSCNSVWCHSNASPVLRGAEAARNSYKPIAWNATTACTTCHRGSETYANMAPASPTDQLSTVHAVHAASDRYSFTCDECHADTMANDSTGTLNATTGYANHVDATKSWKFSTTIRATSLSQENGTYAGGGGACSNIYCHSKGTVLTGTTFNQATNTPVTSPTWILTSLACNGCHGDSGNTDGMPSYGNGTPKANSHDTHVRGFSYICSECHDTTVNASNQITSFANHVNTAFTVSGARIGGYTYDAAGGTCSTVTCHGNNSPQWGATVSCSDCHMGAGDIDDFTYNNGTMARIDSTEWTTYGHGKAGAPLPLTCDYCHSNSATVVSHGVSTNPYRLVNYNVTGKGWNDVCNVCHMTGATGYNPGSGNKTSTMKIDKYHYGAGHDATRNGGQFCVDCHDPHGDSTNIKMVHAKPFKQSNVYAVPTALPTNPVIFTNNTVGAGAGGFAMTAAPFENGLCNACHTAANSPHYSSTSVDGTHYTTVCTGCHQHSKDTTYEGKAFAGGDDCFDCHSSKGGPTSGTTADTYHARHVQTAFIGKLSTGDYGRLTGGSGPNWYTYSNTGGLPDMGCGYCHPTSSANHNNGSIDLNFNPADTGAAGTLKAKNHATQTFSQTTGVTVTCSSVYCHSNGYNPGSGYGYQTSDNWYTATVTGDVCAGCHGNWPNDSGQKSGSPAHTGHAVGIHVDDIYTGTTGTLAAGTGNADSHGDTLYSTTINCSLCHNGTVTVSQNMNASKCISCHSAGANAVAMTIDAASTLHVNGEVDVAFNAVSVKSKAQLRDTITTVAELNNNWTRTVGYKVAGAYDAATNALNTGTMWNGGTKTCSNIACHNGNAVNWTDTISCGACHTALP